MPDTTPTNQKTLSEKKADKETAQSLSEVATRLLRKDRLSNMGNSFETAQSPKSKPKGPARKLMLPLPNTKLFLKTWNKIASKN